MAYWILWSIIRPLLGIFYRVRIVGAENIPRTGGIIISANHQAIVDSFFLSAFIERRLTFMAKSEYFTGSGLRGWLKKKFFAIGAIPVDRSNRRAGMQATSLMVEVLKSGGATGIHPEGTRALAGRVFRGKPGAVDMAWRSGALIVPVALLGTRKPDSPRRFLRRLRPTIIIVVGTPMKFENPLHAVPLLDRVVAPGARFVQTELLMREIANLAGWEYVNKDAQQEKDNRKAAEAPQH